LDYRNGLMTVADLEFYLTVSKGKKGIVFADADVVAGVIGGTTLTDENVAGANFLTTGDFHAEKFTGHIGFLAGRTAGFGFGHSEVDQSR
jgi:hypothetical protein